MPDKDNLLNVPGTYNFPQGVQPTQFQQNAGAGGDYLSGFLQQVNKTAPASDGLNYIPAASVDNTGRFPSVLPGMDSEEAYGQGQTWYSKAGSGIGKGLGIASTTLIQGTVGMVNGVGEWIDKGKFSAFYDNDFNKSLDEINKSLENSLPNYYTQQETNADWFSPKNLFTANFLFDKLIKNAGFAAGAMAGGMAWGGALRVIGLTGKLMQAGAALDVAALDAAEQAMLNAPKAERLSTWLDSLKEISSKGAAGLLNKSDRIITSTLATSGEASMEALQGLNEYRTNLISDYKNKYGVEPSGADLDKINESAEKVGNATFALNTALLSATNYIQFPKIIGSTFKGEKNLLNKELGEIVEDAAGKFAAVQPATKFGRIMAGAKGVSRLLMSPSEAFEEGSQSAIQAGVGNYYKKGYEGKETSIIDDALGFGVHKALTTKDGLESILLGGLTGGLMEARSTIHEQGVLGNKGQKALDTQVAVDALNKTKRLSAYLKDQAAAVERGQVLQQERADAIRKGDVLESKDLETDYVHNYLSSRIKYGKIDSVMNEINAHKAMASTQEGFERLQAQGIATAEDTRDSFNLRLNALEQQALFVRDAYSTLSTKYAGYVNKKTGARIYSDDTIDKMVYAVAKINDYNTRLGQIGGQIANKYTDVLAYNETIKQATEWGKARNPIREAQMKDAIQEVKNGVDSLNIPDAEKEDILSNFSDALEMVVRKQAYMQEYNDIKNNPLASDTTQEDSTKFSVDGKEYLTNRDYNAPAYEYEAEKYGDKWAVKSSKGKVLDTFDTQEDAQKAADGFTGFRSKSPSVRVLYKVGNQIAVRDASGKRFFIDASILENHELVKTQEEVLEGDKNIQDNIVKLGDELSNDSSDIPTGDYTVDVNRIVEENDRRSKKSVVIAQMSSTAPLPESGVGPTAGGDYNRGQREVAFHETLAKNPALADNIRVLALTYNNQAQFGFDFIKPTYPRQQNGKVDTIDNASNSEQGAIALVYVKENEDGTYTTVDHTGAELAQVGQAQDPNKFVFTFMENADATRYSKEKGVDATKFHIQKDKKSVYSQEEVEDILAQGKKFREGLFAYNGAAPKTFKFSVSKGFPNEEKGEPTSVVESKLISQEDLSSRMVIEIPTVKQEGSELGFISVGGETVNFPVGRPVINRGSDYVPLRNGKISKDQANNIFAALEYAANQIFKGNAIPASVLGYVSNVLYTRKGGQVFINKDTKQLVFGGGLSVPLTATALQEEKTAIISYLQSLYHNVNNKTLTAAKTKPEAFYEFTGVENDKPTYRIWKSYQHYLLSPINDLVDEKNAEHGTKRVSPLTVNLKVDKKYEESGVPQPPIRGKYVTLHDYFEYVPTVKKKDIDKAPQPAPNTAAPAAPSNPNFSLPEGTEFNAALLTLDATGTIENTITSKAGASIVFTVNASGINVNEVKTKYAAPISNEADAIAALGRAMGQLQAYSVAKKEEEEVVPEEPTTPEPIVPETQSEPIPWEGDEFAGYRRVGFQESVNKTWDEASFREYMAKKLPMFNINRLKQVIATTDGGFAWGAQRAKFIYLYEGAPMGTEYHEAFEGVWNSFLSPREQELLLADFNRRQGSFINAETGEIIKYSEATAAQAKEEIADEFGRFRTTGEIFKGEIRKMGFFRQLWDFIKALFTTPSVDIQGMFSRIDSGYYRNADFTGNSTTTAYSKIRKEGKVSEAWLKDVMHQMSFRLRAKMQKDGKLVDLAEGKVSKDEAYNTLYALMDNYYRQVAHPSSPFTPEERTTLVEGKGGFRGWNFIKTNWVDFVDENILFNQSLGMSFPKGEYSFDENFLTEEYKQQQTEDSGLSDESFQAKEENRNRIEYDRDITTIDSWASSAAAIKLLFNTLTEHTYPRAVNTNLEQPVPTLSSVGDRKFVEGNKLFYIVQNELIGSKNNEERQERFRKLATKNPALVIMYKAIYDVPVSMRTDADWKIIVQFNNEMSKQRPDVVMQYRDESGETRIINSNTSSLRDKVVEMWAENIKTLYKEDGSGLVIRNPEDSTYSIDTKRIKSVVTDKDSAIKFLEEIKFGFSRTLYNRLDNTQQNEFLTETKKIYELFKKDELIPTTKVADVNGPLKKLAELKGVAEGDPSSGTNSNIENNLIQSNILPNDLSKRNDTINGSSSRGNLLATEPKFRSNYCKHSLLLDVANWKNGKRATVLNTAYVEGSKDEENNVTTLSKANLGQRLLIERNSNLRGIYYALVGADAKTEWAVTFRDGANNPGHFITFEDFKHDGAWQEKLHNTFQDYLRDELALIQDFRDGIGTDNDALATKDGNGVAAGAKLRFFKAVFSALNDNKELGYSGGEKIRTLLTDWANSKEQTQTMDEILEENAEQINLAVDAYMANMTKRQTTFMKREELVVGTDGSFSVEGIDIDMLDKLDMKNGKLKESDIERLLMFTTMNYVIANTELHKVYYGDPAQYKDSVKRIKSFQSGRNPIYTGDEGFNSRMHQIYNAGLQQGAPGYVKFTEDYVALTVDHGDSSKTEIVSERYVTIYSAALAQAEANGFTGAAAIKEANKIAEAYRKVNEADAQAHRIGSSVIEQSIRTGDASEAQKAFFKWDAAYTRLALNESGQWSYNGNTELEATDKALVATPKPKAIFNVRKPIGSGTIERNGMMEAHLFKNSEMPLFYSLLPEGSVMRDLYVFMLQNGIDAIGPQSQHKVGSPTDLPTLYDMKTGKLNVEGMANSQAYRHIPWAMHGKQVETAGEHNGQTIITQLQAIYQQDMFAAGLPVDTTLSQQDWNNLTEDQKKETSTIYNLSQQNAAMRGELSAIGYKSLLNKLGITEEDDNYVAVDGTKLSAFLKEELSRREIDANTLDAIEAVFNPKLNGGKGGFELATPLEALNKYAVIKQMIWAVADREIVHTKMNGGQKIQIAGSMWENSAEGRGRMYKDGKEWKMVEADTVLTAEQEASVKLTSSHYKFYDLQVGDKKIKAMEVGLGCHFRDKIRQSKKLRNMTDKQLLDYLNTEEGRKILTGVGARIPVQGMNSVEVFIVKEFLPEEMGDAIVVPSEITAKAGSDFDVDKLNTYLKNIYVDAEGDLKVVPYYGQGQEAVDKFKKLVDEFESKEDMLSTLLNLNVKADAEAADNFDFKEDDKRIENKALELYRQSIENEYFRTMEDMITLPSNFLRLLTPNSAQELKDLAAEVKATIAEGKRGAEANENLVNTVAKDINYGALFNPMEMAKTRNIFNITKDGVGIAASNVKLFTLLQSGNIRMEGALKLPHNSIQENGKTYISLSQLKDVDGNYISEQNSQSVDGIVDVARDPFYPDLLGFGDLLSPAMFLRGSGVGKDMTYYFLRQPIVQDYMYEKAKDKQRAALNSEYTQNSKAQIKALVLTKWGTGTAPTVSQFNLDELKESIRNPKMEGRNELQKAILEEFLLVLEKSDRIFKVSEGLKWDTAKFRSGAWVDIKEKQWNEALDQEILGLEELMATNYIGGVREQVLAAQQAMIPIFNMEQEEIKSVLRPTQTRISDMFTGTDVKIALMQKVELSLLNYILLTEGKIGGKPINEYFHSVLIGDKNIANQLSEILALVASREDSDLANNPALKALASVRRNNTQATKNVGLIHKPTGAYEQNVMTNALRELKDNPITADFYRTLVLAGMLQSGLINSRISYNSIIPNESYGPIMKGVIGLMDNMSEDDLGQFNRLNVFERTNWNNPLIVPKAKSKSWKYPGDKRLDGIRKNGASFITLRSSENPIPVLKVNVPAINPKTGGEYTLAERKKMAQNGNFSFVTPRLYQYVTNMSTVQDTERGRGAATVALYKQINAWGDGMYAMEMYSSERPSVLPTNEKVQEVSNDDILMAVGRTIMNTPEVNTRKTYSGSIVSLLPNQIFVFGSNPEGRHGAGAALYAKQKFGAITGKGEGLQGQSYALPTKDLRITENKGLRSISKEDIISNINTLYAVANQNPNKEFFVAYSATGSNLNGYTNKEMAQMFSSFDIPTNMVFEEGFNKLITSYKTNTNGEDSNLSQSLPSGITLKDGNQYSPEDINTDMLEAMNYSPEEAGDILEKFCKGL